MIIIWLEETVYNWFELKILDKIAVVHELILLTVFKVQSTHMTLSPCSVIVNSGSLMLTKKKKPSVYKHPSRKNNYRERRAVPYFPATPSFQIKFTICQFQLAISGKKKFYFLLFLFPNQKLVLVT